MTPVPPPVGTPKPAYDEPSDADSGVRQLSAREVKALMKAQKEAAEAEARTKRLRRYLAAGVSLFATTVLGTVSAMAWGQGKIDAGVEKGIAPVEKRVATLEADSASTKANVQQLQLDGVRQTTMLEMLVKERRMEPPPPAPKVLLPDGGSP